MTRVCRVSINWHIRNMVISALYTTRVYKQTVTVSPTVGGSANVRKRKLYRMPLFGLWMHTLSPLRGWFRVAAIVFRKFEPLGMQWIQVWENAGLAMIGIAMAFVVLISFFPRRGWYGHLLCSVMALSFCRQGIFRLHNQNRPLHWPPIGP